MLLGDILRKNARPEMFGGKTALVFGDRRWTYAALNAGANRIANALLGLGVSRGDRVDVLGRNSDVYVAIYFALAKLGAIMVPVNFWYRAEEVRYTLDQSGSRWLLAEESFLPIAADATALTAEPIQIIVYNHAAIAHQMLTVLSGASADEQISDARAESWIVEPSSEGRVARGLVPRRGGGEGKMHLPFPSSPTGDKPPRYTLPNSPLQDAALRLGSEPEREATANRVSDAASPSRFLSLESLLSDASDAEPDARVSPEDPHIILYTSGTTGFPKGATFSHRAHYLHAVAWALQTGQRAEDVGVVVYPLFHTGGPDCLVLPHFLVGGTVVVQDGADPKAILDAAEREHLTNVFCVPTVWRWILAELERAERDGQPYDVSSVRRCLGSSDTLPPDLLSGLLDRFDAEVWVTYGLTEAGCILTYSRLTRADQAKIHTVGKPHPLVELRIVDPGGDEVPRGEVGEIVARGPTLMEGYWNLPERTAEAMDGGWLHSGDLGRYDADGYISIAGRLKDMIVSGGEKIYPVEVEKLLCQHPKIKDAALVGVPDREWGQAVLAVVVLEPGAELSADEVIAFVRSRLAGYKRPRYVEFVDALPTTTATNKVQKSVLRERFSPKYAG